jgi:hypothetical protein
VVGEEMLPSSLKEGDPKEHHQEVKGHLDGSLLPKDPLQDVIKIRGMRGTLEDHLQSKIPTVNPKGDTMRDQDLNIKKERGNIKGDLRKEGNMKSPGIEEGGIHLNKGENIKMNMIEEEDIHHNKEGTHGLNNTDGIHKVSTINKEWPRRFLKGDMLNPGIEDLLRDKEKRVEGIFVPIAEEKYMEILTAASYVDGAWKLRKDALHLIKREEMIIPRGREIEVNRREEGHLQDGKDRWKVE